jgi:hypothetical protein
LHRRQGINNEPALWFTGNVGVQALHVEHMPDQTKKPPPGCNGVVNLKALVGRQLFVCETYRVNGMFFFKKLKNRKSFGGTGIGAAKTTWQGRHGRS